MAKTETTIPPPPLNPSPGRRSIFSTSRWPPSRLQSACEKLHDSSVELREFLASTSSPSWVIESLESAASSLKRGKP